MNKVLFLIFLFVSKIVFAQACCSAGVPLLGSLELPSTPKDSWQFALTFEQNVLQDVIDRSSELDDNLRERLVHTFLFEVSTGITERLSVSGLFSYLRQERSIFLPFSDRQSDFLLTRGFGDGIILLKYDLIPLNIISQRQIGIGLGPKLPLGSPELKDQGILVPADMQPGSGAWDLVLWSYFYQGFLPHSRLNLYGTVTGRWTGTNRRGYRFGPEWVATLNTSYRTDSWFDFTAGIRLRNSRPDEFQQSEIFNTGGTWFNFLPGLNLKPADNWVLRTSSQIPLYRWLRGTQLTTSYRFSVSLFYTFTKNNRVHF